MSTAVVRGGRFGQFTGTGLYGIIKSEPISDMTEPPSRFGPHWINKMDNPHSWGSSVNKHTDIHRLFLEIKDNPNAEPQSHLIDNSGYYQGWHNFNNGEDLINPSDSGSRMGPLTPEKKAWVRWQLCQPGPINFEDSGSQWIEDHSQELRQNFGYDNNKKDYTFPGTPEGMETALTEES